MSIENILRKNIDRREFLKKSGQAALAVGGALTLDALLSGCATVGFKEEGPVVYPRLKGHKVQPPEKGCLIGFTRDRWHPFYDEFVRAIGKKPKIIMPSVGIAMHSTEWPKSAVKYVDSKGGILFLYRDLSIDIRAHGFSNLVDSKEFRNDLTEYAKHLEERGKPLFVCTMRELNGDWYPWGQQSKTAKKVWRHMWQIFEDTGANEYATWVWEVYCPEQPPGNVDNPEKYYPGDEYVDWIGLSSYSRTKLRSGIKSFNELVSPTYRQMRRNYPEKPVIMAEFGKTRGSNQARWLQNAFETIKSWPGMKAAIYWDNKNVELGDDHTLNKKSYEALKEIFKDPYFIGSTEKGRG